MTSTEPKRSGSNKPPVLVTTATNEGDRLDALIRVKELILSPANRVRNEVMRRGLRLIRWYYEPPIHAKKRESEKDAEFMSAENRTYRRWLKKRNKGLT